VMRLTDMKKNRLQRTCPTMLDKYVSYDSCAGFVNNPLGGIESASDYDNIGNGAWNNLIFTAPNGDPLQNTFTPGAVPLATPAYGTAVGSWPAYASWKGMPVAPPLWDPATNYAVPVAVPPTPYLVQSGGLVWVVTGAAPVVGVAPAPGQWTSLGAIFGVALQFYIRWGSTEKLILSPFTFSDCHEWDTGLFGINNIQLIMNLQSPGFTSGARILRTTGAYGATFSALGYNTTMASVFANSRLNVQFLTPSLDVPLPPKSVVPYMEFPRYITSYGTLAVSPGAVTQLQSQTITLPQIPDLFIIYVKPGGDALPNTGDWYLPVAGPLDGVTNPLTVNFDNFSGLLSSQTPEQLYAMSVHNGLDMDWNSWSGAAHSGAAMSIGNLGGNTSGALAAGRVAMVGGLLVLKPSQDITLQTGQAPSLVGNFTFQFNLQVKNTSSNAIAPTLYVITANSGFFESIRGSSRIIKGVLSEQDIISAPLAPMGTRDKLQRMVGGGLLSNLASALGKAGTFYNQHKDTIHGALRGVRGMLPETGMLGKVRRGLEMTGHGSRGGKSGGLHARLL